MSGGGREARLENLFLWKLKSMENEREGVVNGVAVGSAACTGKK